jgi:hypothetical protein
MIYSWEVKDEKVRRKKKVQREEKGLERRVEELRLRKIILEG